MDWQLSRKPASARPQDLCELHLNAAYAKAWKEWRDGGMEGWKKQNGNQGEERGRTQGTTMGLCAASDGAWLNPVLPVASCSQRGAGSREDAVGVLTSHFNLTPTSLFLSVYFIPLPVRISVSCSPLRLLYKTHGHPVYSPVSGTVLLRTSSDFETHPSTTLIVLDLKRQLLKQD